MEMTLSQLVAEAASRIAALPAPTNGQVRAVPDERTVRYYGTIGLLDKPTGHRGRTALYAAKHLAQIVAIKRMQTLGRSLAEIQALWPTMDATALTRMSGVEVAAATSRSRANFWRAEPGQPAAPDMGSVPISETGSVPISETGSVPISETGSVPISRLTISIDLHGLADADVAAIRAAAAPLIAELARIGTTR